MNFMELTRVAADEKRSEVFLRERGVLVTFKRCPRCGSPSPWETSRASLLCRSCGRETSVRHGSVLSRSKLPLGTFLMLAAMFGLEVSSFRCSRTLGVNRNTATKYYQMFREAVASEVSQLSGEVEADESYFGPPSKGKRGRGAEKKVKVFGIIERKGRVKVEVVDDVTAEILVERLVKTVKRGSLIYTDKFRAYDTLAEYGFRHESIDHSRRYARGKVSINGIEGFWSYCKERLLKSHGVSRKHFPSYLAELEARYNNRDRDFFDILMESLAKKTTGGTY